MFNGARSESFSYLFAVVQSCYNCTPMLQLQALSTNEGNNMAARVRMNIVISEQIRKMVDREAKKKDMSMSAVVRTALLKYFGGKR
jgi:hypothetical protein